LAHLALWLAPPAIILAGAVIQPYAPFQELSRDPYAIAWDRGRCIEPYTGFLSTLGLFVWAGLASVCAFVAWLNWTTRRFEAARFFASCAALNGYILADDAFLIHEGLIPLLGGGEEIGLAVLGVLALTHMAAFRRSYGRANFWLLSIAAMFLGVSVGYDLAFPDVSETNIIIEDGAKFIGLWAWAGLHVGLALESATLKAESMDAG
jgi:hypothetical protein